METQDVIIIGSGIGGLSLAIELNKSRPDIKILVITKAATNDCNTSYAQGGIAAVMDTLIDSYESHIGDTLKCGRGLCDESVVRMVVTEAPERIKELENLGANFDEDSQQHYELGLEGGHSAHRIVHHKDKTGQEVENTLVNQLKTRRNITVLDNCIVVDLITRSKGIPDFGLTCEGVITFDSKTNIKASIWARTIVLASGGCGQVYKNTTNPLVATGDGFAIAYRAGAKIQNMRFMQFHPTSLYSTLSDGVSFLISEAVRGYGAYIVDNRNNRFIFDYDKRGELATRDIISSAITDYMAKTCEPCVYLDLRHLNKEKCEAEFPQITDYLTSLGYDISRDLIPIVPSAHYQCGGVVVNKDAETSISNLYAVGEVSYTGLHGANRLASNSLLEALVYAHHAALKILTYVNHNNEPISPNTKYTDEIQIGDFYTPKKIDRLILDIKTKMSAIAFDPYSVRHKALMIDLIIIQQFVNSELSNNRYSAHLLKLRNINETAILITQDIIDSIVPVGII